MASKAYGFTSLTGGGVGALDAIDGAVLSDGDMAFGVDSDQHYVYQLDSSSSSAESSPTIIAPDANGGAAPNAKRWVLSRVMSKDGITLYDGTNIGVLQFNSNVLELYNQRHSGVTKIMVEDAGGNKETALVATGAGSVDLYYDNAKKIETTSTGVKVTNDIVDSGGSTLIGRKNIILNGGFDVWQRAIDTSGITSTLTFVADRFGIIAVGGGVLRGAQSQSSPTVAEAGRSFQSCLLVKVATADASIAVGDYAGVFYRVEGYDIRPFIERTLTLSFWVRATKTGIYCIQFCNSASDRTYIAEYTVNSVDTWEKKTITFTMHDGTSGTWNFTNGVGLAIGFILASGSTYHGTKDVWQSANVLATSNQINAIDSTANEFRIVGVQLEAGSVATAFEYRPYAEELDLCQRYCQVIDSKDGNEFVCQGGPVANNNFWGVIPINEMRTEPTLSYSALSDFLIQDLLGGQWAPTSLVLSSASSKRAATFDVGVSGAPWTAQKPLFLRIAAMAGKLILNAEF